MTHSLVMLLATAIAFGCVTAVGPQTSAQDAPAKLAALAADASVDEVLDALDARGQTLQDFSAGIVTEEVDEATGLASRRSGRVLFQRLPDNDARMRIVLDKRFVRDRAVNEKIEYLYSQGELTERDYRREVHIRRQVLRPGEKLDLFKLGEGPFPLPLGQSREDVKRYFEVTKVEPTDDDPANTIHLHLVPHPGTDYARRLDSIDFWIDRQIVMPVRIQTVIGNEIATRDLSEIQVNTNLTDKDFELEPVDQRRWQIRFEPFEG